MDNREFQIKEGLEIANGAKKFEKDEQYDFAAKEYKKARNFFEEIKQGKLWAKCSAAHIVNIIKYYLWPRDIELFSTNMIGFYIKKLDGLRSLGLSKCDEYDILMKTYRELEKVFADCHMDKYEDQMYYERTCLYHKYQWEKIRQKDRKFIARFMGFFPFIKELYLNKFCGHGEKPWRAVGGITFYILFFSILFKCCDLIEFVDPQKNLCFWQSLYFSVITFTTLGYGDILPIGTAGQIVVITEVTLGVLSLGLLLATLTRKFTK